MKWELINGRWEMAQKDTPDRNKVIGHIIAVSEDSSQCDAYRRELFIGRFKNFYDARDAVEKARP